MKIGKKDIVSCDIPPFVDSIIGRKFGRLTVNEFLGYVVSTQNQRQWIWKTVCDCGNVITVRGSSLRNGHTKSCGCKKNEAIASLRKTHGMSESLTYESWRGMRERCEYEKHVAYHRYGGRGIAVIERWRYFENFLADMGERPSKKHQIDRIDNSRGYEPGNCRWTTGKIQCRNTRRNRFLTVDGVSRTVAEWSELTGINYAAILDRSANGWSDKDSVSIPVGVVSKYNKNKRV